MPATFASRPAPKEYAEYYGRYISQLPDGDVLDIMRSQTKELFEMFAKIDDAKALHRYAPGKWSIKEVLGHMLDVERVFSHRALRMARADKTPLPGFEQDDYVAAANFDGRPLESLLDEWRHLRAANLTLFESFDEVTLMRQGTASGYEFTVRALIWIMAGHERHHLNGLRANYL
jgi:uncharacterized damage-inducible protein DinB